LFLTNKLCLKLGPFSERSFSNLWV